MEEGGSRELRLHALKLTSPPIGLQDNRSTRLYGGPGGRARPRRRARVPAARDHEPAITRLLHRPRPLNHLIDNPSTTQNFWNLDLTGDLAPLLDGGQNEYADHVAVAVVRGRE